MKLKKCLSLSPAAIVLASGLSVSAQSQPEASALHLIQAPIVNLPETAESAVAVTVDASAFDNGTVLLPLGAGETLRAHVKRTQHHSDVSTGWSGTLEGVEHGWFSIVQYEDAFHAIIGAGELGKFSLRASGQSTDAGLPIYNLIKVNESAFAGCATDNLANPLQAAPKASGLTSGSHEHNDNDTDDNTNPAFVVDDGSVIDVMIVYTAEARVGWGGTANIMALAQNCIDTSNITYANSQMTPLHELRLVHAQEIIYTESGDSFDDLVALADTIDGDMDDVHMLRDTHGADLVALLVNSFDACGIAFLNPFDDEYGFSAIATSCAVDNLSFPHEIGHNMGATHDRDNAGGAAFSYGYGWRWTSTNGQRYRTVMAYSQNGDTRVPYFSNPDVNYIGTPTGVANSEDNARVHEETRSSIAKYRNSVSTPDCVADTNGDGMLSPADFTAWIAAFNAQSAACDQNNDGMCSPADFTAWIANYNAGC